ncbi:MAG: protein translocase subunit SecD [Clostridiales bacterium]|nr:protein translocase subunit SecD [Clostridiales bacterium]
MKLKSTISLIAVIVLIAVGAFFTVDSVSFGGYRTIPSVKAISQGLDLRGGVYAVYEAQDNGEGDFAKNFETTIGILTTRLTAQGYTEATVVRQGTNRIRVEIPDVDDPEQILNIIGTPAHLTFRDPDNNVIMEGDTIVSAEPMMNTQTGEYLVSFKLDSEGTKKFADATYNLIGKEISIYLDDNLQMSAVVQEAITGGEGSLTGDYTYDSARQLAILIQSGALPLDIEQIELRTVSATLGVNALDNAITAGVIGVLLVMLFMIIMYRLPGVVATLALMIYIIIDLFLLAHVPGVQLTLPGIAGIILSIGMAVDANVVIFERIKEELRSGKMTRPAINSGYQRAFSAILDSNITTIIAAVVLGIFGTGTIKSFAMTLGIGVVTSMFTAIVVTRWLLNTMLGFGITNKALYGVNKKEVEAK